VKRVATIIADAQRLERIQRRVKSIEDLKIMSGKNTLFAPEN